MNLKFWLYQHLFSIINFLLALVFFSIILRSRKPPASTLAWFLLVLVAPYVGIPLYLMLGARKMGWKSRSKPHLYGRGTTSLPSQDPTERILIASGAPGKRANSSIEFLDTGVRAFEELVRSIESARQRIHLATFIFGNDEVGRKVLERLTRKAAAGVETRLLVDSVGSLMAGHPSFREFRHAGGRIAYFMPFIHAPFRGRTNLRNHRKMAIVDGTVSLIGGMNIAREYMGPAPFEGRWRDLAIRIEGPCTADLEHVFLSDWNFTTGEKIEVKAASGATGASGTGPCEAQVVASGPDVPADPLYDALISAIFSARERIWIATPYFVPDEALTKGLELAAKRGVDLRLVIPYRSNHFLADLARGSYVSDIESCGAKILLYPRMMHAKAVLIDGAHALLTSANLDMRSLLLNYEAGVVLYSEREIARTTRWFEELFATCAPGFPRAARFNSWAEGIGRMIGPFI